MKTITKIFAVGCTHRHHEDIVIPNGMDIMVHTGDESNSRDIEYNKQEFFEFINWYAQVPIQHRVYIPGNHSTYVEKNIKTAKKECAERGINMLLDSSIELNGLNFYGSPWSPAYGNWAFQIDRSKIGKKWKQIPYNTDILITHGPPLGILDITDDYPNSRKLISVGDRALYNIINTELNIKYHMFSHIHDNADTKNYGVLYRDGIYYVNCAMVEDKHFDEGIKHDGHIITIERCNYCHQFNGIHKMGCQILKQII